MSKPFWLGTSPFCSPDEIQCSATPGFGVGKKDKCGDGNCCWTGKKIECKFNDDLWKSSAVYKHIKNNNNGQDIDTPPIFKWYGTSPFCGAETCEVIRDGMIPIGFDNRGDGKSCMTGQKILGMYPITDYQKEEVRNAAKDCWEFKKMQEQTLQAGLNMGGSVAGAIGAFAK